MQFSRPVMLMVCVGVILTASCLSVRDAWGRGSKSRQDLMQVFLEVIIIAHDLSSVPILNLCCRVHSRENDLGCGHDNGV